MCLLVFVVFLLASFFHSRKKSGKIKTEFEHRFIHTNVDVDFDFAGPTIVGSAVVG